MTTEYLPEKIKEEPDSAYSFFLIYCKLGPSRNLRNVVAQTGKSLSYLRKLSSQYAWWERARKYDATIAEAEASQIYEHAVKKAAEWADRANYHREEEWKIRTELMTCAMEALVRWKKNQLHIATPAEITRMFDLASRLGRMASGLSVEKVEHAGNLDLSFMAHIETALKRVYENEQPLEQVIDTQTNTPSPQYDGPGKLRADSQETGS